MIGPVFPGATDPNPDRGGRSLVEITIRWCSPWAAVTSLLS